MDAKGVGIIGSFIQSCYILQLYYEGWKIVGMIMIMVVWYSGGAKSHEAQNVEMKWIEPILASNGNIVCLMVLIKWGCHLVHTEEITQADDDYNGGGDTYRG